MLYIKLKKALYGTIQAALLFWRLLLVLTLNGYSNLMNTTNVSQTDSEWEQFMLIGHVDDLKI